MHLKKELLIPFFLLQINRSLSEEMYCNQIQGRRTDQRWISMSWPMCCQIPGHSWEDWKETNDNVHAGWTTHAEISTTTAIATYKNRRLSNNIITMKNLRKNFNWHKKRWLTTIKTMITTKIIKKMITAILGDLIITL